MEAISDLPLSWLLGKKTKTEQSFNEGLRKYPLFPHGPQAVQTSRLPGFGMRIDRIGCRVAAVAHRPCFRWGQTGSRRHLEGKSLGFRNWRKSLDPENAFMPMHRIFHIIPVGSYNCETHPQSPSSFMCPHLKHLWLSKREVWKLKPYQHETVTEDVEFWRLEKIHEAVIHREGDILGALWSWWVVRIWISLGRLRSFIKVGNKWGALGTGRWDSRLDH